MEYKGDQSRRENEFSLNRWMDQYQEAVFRVFKDRVVFIGLQGSCGRGEETPKSDIDVVLILDLVCPADLGVYSELLDGLFWRDKACGFISGRQELLSWEPSDLFQFYYDTLPLYGSLDEIANKLTDADVRRAIHTGVCNIYHMCAHNMVHEKDEEILKGLYKQALFTLRAIEFQNSKRYERSLDALYSRLQPEEKKILEVAQSIKRGNMPEAFFSASSLLLVWSSRWIKRCSQQGREEITS